MIPIYKFHPNLQIPNSEFVDSNKIGKFGFYFCKGQGLLETIVAIGVLMTGLISVMSLVVSNLNSEREAATRYQAVNLAREGVEIIRNARDTNWLSGNAAWEGLSAMVASVSADSLPAPFENFSRQVSINPINCLNAFPPPDSPCEEIERQDPIAQEVTATVNWSLSGKPKMISITETLYDWR